ncbi:MAG: hypothetical protein FWF92_10645 [Oscillospiraceae bacterium]|nr:hypothetical protein [Oscillospiraceae bacterium]
MNDKSKIIWFEPVVFIFFGIFHLHRIWGLTDRNGYSKFWLSIMNDRGWFYYVLMGLMSVLCVAGIIVFLKNKNNNYWWRWFYIFGGGYVIFDLFAITIKLEIWKNLIYWMYDASNKYWNIVWGGFIILGLISLSIGILVTKKRLKFK